MLYCVEVERELEEKCVLHVHFNTIPTREDILKFVEKQDLEYDDNYGKLTYYPVKIGSK